MTTNLITSTRSYNAMVVKNWIINKITPMGWSMMISRALPELLEVNPSFSLIRIGKSTYWSENEIMVIQEYLDRIFGLYLPDELLKETEELDDLIKLESSNFFSFGEALSDFSSKTRRFFRRLVI